MSKSISHCLYRGPEGLKCAAGCLISDNDYALDLQGNKEKAREALEARIAGKKSTKKGRITK